MKKRGAGLRAAEAEIIDDQYIRPQVGHKGAEETIEKIAWLMDRSIPIGGIRVGLDPILGLVPGVGDVFSSFLSAVLIFNAHRAGVPRATVLRMMANVGIDTILGAIPFVGDLFDFAWKANSRNLALYRASIHGTHRTSKDWGFLALVLVMLAAFVTIPIVLAFWIIQAIF